MHEESPDLRVRHYPVLLQTATPTAFKRLDVDGRLEPASEENRQPTPASLPISYGPPPDRLRITSIALQASSLIPHALS